jgi:hypothetical protein
MLELSDTQLKYMNEIQKHDIQFKNCLQMFRFLRTVIFPN